MIKKLTIALSSAALLGLAVSAYADDAATTADYGPQATTANNSGFYVGGQVGRDWMRAKSQTASGLTAKKGSHTGGFAGRLDAGYDFNQYLSAEMGYTYLGSYDTQISPLPATFKRSLYAFDAMGKVTYPFADKLFVFVGAGAAYVHSDYTSGTMFGVNYTGENGLKHGAIRPKAELGVGYNLTDNVALDLSYSRIFGVGSPMTNDLQLNKKYLPNIDMLGVGLTYKF